jgi:hypothetical protein
MVASIFIFFLTALVKLRTFLRHCCRTQFLGLVRRTGGANEGPQGQRLDFLGGPSVHCSDTLGASSLSFLSSSTQQRVALLTACTLASLGMTFNLASNKKLRHSLRVKKQVLRMYE